jgi:hypothetical protein
MLIPDQEVILRFSGILRDASMCTSNAHWDRILWLFASNKTRAKTSWRLSATYDMEIVLKSKEDYLPYDKTTWQCED